MEEDRRVRVQARDRDRDFDRSVDRRDPRPLDEGTLRGATCELQRRFVLAVHWQPPRYYFNVNVLAIVTKINNNAYATDM